MAKLENTGHIELADPKAVGDQSSLTERELTPALDACEVFAADLELSDESIMDCLSCNPLDIAPEHLEPTLNLIIDGNPAIGELTVYSQEHYVGGMLPRAVEQIAHFQLGIWQQLERDKPGFVFQEGHHDQIDISSQESLEYAAYIRSIFPGNEIPHPQELTEEQTFHLAVSGAAYIYQALHPNEVQIMATVSFDNESEVYQRMDELATQRTEMKQELDQLYLESRESGELSEEFHKLDRRYTLLGQELRALRYDERERLSICEVMHFLEENPGAKVALVYGSAHRWTPDDFVDQQQNELPVAMEYRWDDLSARYLDTELAGSAQMFSEATPDQRVQIAAGQLSAIANAIEVSPSVWGQLVSAEAQLAALPKMWSDRRLSTAEELLQAVRESAISEEVIALAEELHEQRDGPFEALRPRPEISYTDLENNRRGPFTWDEVEQFDPFDAADAIQANSDHLATQLEIVRRIEGLSVTAASFIGDLEELQLAAIEKIVRDPSESRDEIYQALKRNFDNPYVRARIDEMYMDGEGPF